VKCNFSYQRFQVSPDFLRTGDFPNGISSAGYGLETAEVELTYTYEQVPEPGTLPVLFGGLAQLSFQLCK
jgi:hypothetical protein